MKNERKIIVYIEGAENLGGSVICLRNILLNLNLKKYIPIVIFLYKGNHEQILNEIPYKVKTISLNTPYEFFKKSRLFILSSCLSLLFERIPHFFLLLCIFLKYKISIVHMNNGVYYPAILIARLFRAKSICYLRSSVQSLPLIPTTMAPFVNEYIAASPSVKITYSKLGFPDDKIHVIYDYIDRKKVVSSIPVDKMAVLRTIIPDLSIYSKIIGTVARVDDPKKGIIYLINAIPKVVSMYSDVKFIIVGGDLNSKYVKELIGHVTSLGIDKIIFFTGYRLDALRIISCMDIFIVPSLEPSNISLGEGMPIVILEAMALGKPVIASRVSGVTEAFSDKEEGIFVQPKDSEDIANNIIYLLEHPNVREKFAFNAARLVEKKYNKEQFAKEINEVYANLL